MTMHLISIDPALSNSDWCAFLVFNITGNDTAEIVHIERHRNLRYDEIVSRTLALRDWLGGCPCVVDASGNGRPIFQALQDKVGTHAIGIQITGSKNHATKLSLAGLFHISKMQAIKNFASAIRTGKIRIAAGMPLAKELVAEASSLSTKVSRAGRLIVSEPDRKMGVKHDDLVLAAAQAMPVLAQLEQAG